MSEIEVEMRNTIKHCKREARHLFRLCLVNGTLNDVLVRQVLERVLDAKRHGYLALATELERLVRLERQRQSASRLPPDMQKEVATSAARLYGDRIIKQTWK